MKSKVKVTDGDLFIYKEPKPISVQESVNLDAEEGSASYNIITQLLPSMVIKPPKVDRHIVSSGVELAAPEDSDVVIPSARDIADLAFNMKDGPIDNSAEAKADTRRSKKFNEIFFDYRERSMMHTVALLNLIGFIKLDDLICERIRYITGANIPSLEDRDLEGMIDSTRKVSFYRTSKNHSQKFWSEGLQNKVGASIDDSEDEKKVLLHMPLSAGRALSLAVSISGTGITEARSLIQTALPRAYGMWAISRAEAWPIFIRKAIAQMVFPTGKTRISIPYGVPDNLLERLLNMYVSTNAEDRTEIHSGEKASPINSHTIGYILDNLQGDMEFTASMEVDPYENIGPVVIREDDTKITPMHEAADSKEHLAKFIRLAGDVTVDLHTKIELPLHMSRVICQAEDCTNLRKIHTFGTKLMGLAYPEGGHCNGRVFNEGIFSLDIQDGHEADKAAAAPTQYKGYELSPMKPVKLTDENNIGIDGSSSKLMWIPESSIEDTTYEEFLSKADEEHVVEMEGETIYSPFMVEFLSENTTTKELAEGKEHYADFANSHLGDIKFIHNENISYKGNKFLRASSIYSLILYTNDKQQVKAIPIDNVQPAQFFSYERSLRTSFGLHPNRISLLRYLGELCELAGVPSDPLAYIKREDFDVIIGPGDYTVQQYRVGSFIDVLQGYYGVPAGLDFNQAWKSWIGAATFVEFAILGAFNVAKKILKNEYAVEGTNLKWLWGRELYSTNEERESAASNAIFGMGSLVSGINDDFTIEGFDYPEWQQETSIYNLLTATPMAFIWRAVKAIVDKIGGDFKKLEGHKNGVSYNPVLITLVPTLHIMSEWHFKLKELSAKAVESNSHVLDVTKTADEPNREPEALPFMGKDRGFLPHQLKAERHLKVIPPPKYSVLDIGAGGGKTLIAITDALRFIKNGAKKILVTAPGTLIPQWTEEIHKFSDGKMNAFPIVQTETITNYFKGDYEALLKAIIDCPVNTLFVMSSTILSHNSQEFSYEGYTVERNLAVEALAQIEWDVVYVDESHRAKKPTSGYYSSYVRILNRAKHIRLMSGTFVHNTAKDIHGQTRLLYPGVFSSEKAFISTYMGSVDPNDDSDSSLVFKRHGERSAVKKLAQHVDFVQIRRSEWSQTLPELEQQFYAEDLTDNQREIYELLVNLMMTKDEDRADKVIEAINKDDEVAETNIQGIEINSYLQRVEKFLTAPDKDPFQDIDETIQKEKDAKKEHDKAVRQRLAAEEINRLKHIWQSAESETLVAKEIKKLFSKFSEIDKVSPKARALIRTDADGKLVGILAKHFDLGELQSDKELAAPRRSSGPSLSGSDKGKVMIYTSYKDSAESVYNHIRKFPEFKNYILHYTASRQRDLIDEMKFNPKVQIVIGVETSLNTGFNFQMFSRLIRLEMVWTPGELEQGESRIYRPDMDAYLGDKVRAKVYVDIVGCNKTLDIAKAMRLIAKQVSNAKANNILVEQLDNIDNLPAIKMSAANMLAGYSFDHGEGEEYESTYRTMVSILSDVSENNREEIIDSFPEKLYAIESLPNIEGSAIAEMPIISGSSIPFKKELNILSFSEMALKKGKTSSTLDYEDIEEVERRVHTLYGDGYLEKITDSTVSVIMDNGEKVTSIHKYSIFFIPDGFDGTVREAQAQLAEMEYVQITGKEFTEEGTGLVANLSELLKKNMKLLDDLALEKRLDELREFVIDMGLMDKDTAESKRTSTIMEVFRANPQTVEAFEFPAYLFSNDEEDSNLYEEIIKAMRDDTSWTKDYILSAIADDMGLVSKRTGLYKNVLAKKRRTGLLTWLEENEEEYRDTVIKWWNNLPDEDEVDDTEEYDEDKFQDNMERIQELRLGDLRDLAVEMDLLGDEAYGKQKSTLIKLFNKNPAAIAEYEFEEEEIEDLSESERIFEGLNELTKGDLVSIAYNLEIYDTLEDAKSDLRKNLLAYIREEKDVFIKWYDSGMPEREEEENLVPINLSLLQINNLISISIGKEYMQQDIAASLEFEEIGEYAYFNCSTIRKFDAFMDKLDDLEQKNKLDVKEEYWWPLLHLHELFKANPKGDKLAIMDKAQQSDIRNFFKEKRTRADSKNKRIPTLELYPVVFDDTRDSEPQDRQLIIMAYKEKQEDAYRMLTPGKFKTKLGETWTREKEGFYLRMFANRTTAKNWIKKVDVALEEHGFELENKDKMLEVIDEFRVVKVKKDESKLQEELKKHGWGDIPDK